MNSIEDINEPIDKIIRILNESNISLKIKQENKTIFQNTRKYECTYNNKTSIICIVLQNNIVKKISCDYSIISNDISVFVLFEK